MDMAAEEMGGTAALDEVADGGGSGVQAGTDLVERGAVGRGVADQDQRMEGGERGEAFGELCLGVFAGGMERGRVGIAEAGDAPGAGREVALVEVVQAVLIAKSGDLGLRFVVAGKYPYRSEEHT